MTLEQVINELQFNYFPNITIERQASEEDLLPVINEGIRTLHGMFPIRKEQAIIFVPEYRDTFKLSSEDPNVVMATYSKMAALHLEQPIKDKEDSLNDLIVFNKALRVDAMMEGESKNKKLFTNEYNQVMQLLAFYDQKKREYPFNIEKVFVLDPITIWIEGSKPFDIYYVDYKPMPKVADLKNKSEHIDLPDTLLPCLYAFVALRVVVGIERYSQFYPNLVQTYNARLAEARASAAVMPDDMNSIQLIMKKGFV